MRFTYFDFYMLSAVQKEIYLSDAVCSVCEYLPFAPSKKTIESCISKLIGSGYIEYRCGKLMPTSKRALFFKDKKFLESRKAQAVRLKDKLCESEAAAADFVMDEGDYNSAQSKINETYSIDPPIFLNGNMLSFKGEQMAELDEDCVSVGEYEFTLTDINRFATDLLSVCAELTRPTKARKLCLDCTDASFVLTFSGSGNTVKIKAQKILFNRKRFSGKLNSDLDYAQCSDSVLEISLSLSSLLECAALISLDAEECFDQGSYSNLKNIT